MPPKWNEGCNAASQSGVGLHQWQRQRTAELSWVPFYLHRQFLGPWLSPALHNLLQPLTKVSPKAVPSLSSSFHLSVAFSESDSCVSISSSSGLPYMAASLQRPCLLTFLSPNPRYHQLTHCVIFPAQHTEFFLHIKKTDTTIPQTFN